MLVVTVIIDPSGHEHLTATAEEFYDTWRRLLQVFGDDLEVEVYSRILPDPDRGLFATHPALGLSNQLLGIAACHRKTTHRNGPFGGAK